MPYIATESRERIDYAIEELSRALLREKRATQVDGLGLLNYSLTHLILDLIPADGLNYSTIAGVTGVLENVKQEFYRRAAAPYEDEKRVQNGDVYHR